MRNGKLPQSWLSSCIIEQRKLTISFGRICKIWCDEAAINRVPKAWVPQLWNTVPLWWDTNDAIDQYIVKSVDKDWNFSGTILLSFLDDFGQNPNGPQNVQLLIPGALVDNLGITAQCWNGLDALPLPWDVVFYDGWNNVKGSATSGQDPQQPDEPPSDPSTNGAPFMK